jgi:hypothetical protein
VGYRRLRALVDHGLVSRSRLVHGQPTLYVATREGIAWTGMPEVDPARVGDGDDAAFGRCVRGWR